MKRSRDDFDDWSFARVMGQALALIAVLALVLFVMQVLATMGAPR